MTLPNETPTVTAGTKSKLGFFNLPRELRDEIYDLALEHDRSTTKDSGAMHLHVRAPKPRLRLVSKRFASEYYERSPSKDDICLSVTGTSATQELLSAGDFTYAAQATTANVSLTFDPFDNSLYDYDFTVSVWLTELVTDMPCIKTIDLQLCFAVDPRLTMFDWFLRTAHRAVPYIARSFVEIQHGRFRPVIIALNKVDVMVVMPKLDSDDADSTGSELGKVASWTPAGGYTVATGIAEIRRKYGGS